MENRMYGAIAASAGFGSGTLQDRHRNRHAVMDADLELNAIAASIAGGVCKCGTDDIWKITEVNEGFARLFGYHKEKILPAIGGDFSRLVYPEDLPALREAFREQLGHGNRVETEYRCVTKSGELIWILEKSELITEQDGHSWLCCVLVDITERKQMEENLRISEERYKIALSQSDHTVFDYDPVNDRIHLPASKSNFEMDGIVVSQPVLLVERGLIHQDYAADFLKMFREIADGAETALSEGEVRNSDGTYHWSRITLTGIRDNSGKTARAVGVMEDVSAQKRAEQMMIREQQYRDAILSDSLLIYEINLTRDELASGNENWERQLGVKPTSCYSEMIDAAAKQAICPDDRELFLHKFSRNRLLDAFQNGKTEMSMEYRRPHNGSAPIWVLCTTHLVKDPITGEVKGITYVKDINEQKEKALAMQFKSERDSLSGLYNKGTTEHLIKNYLKSEKCKNGIHALMVIDVDDFKSLNDTLGHQFGDAVLSGFSESLKTIFRSSDVIGRIGGDEFLVFLKDITKVDSALRKANEIQEAMHCCYEGSRSTTRMTVSIGIALYPENGTTFCELFKNADNALYQSKGAGKHGCTVYGGEEFIPRGAPRVSGMEGKQQLRREQLLEYIFRILYSTGGTAFSVNAVLEMLCLHLDVSRGYLFRSSPDDTLEKRYEWCAPEIRPLSLDFQRLSSQTYSLYAARFRQNDILTISDPEELEEDAKNYLNEQGTKSLLHCAIKKQGVKRGILGFDECRTRRIPTQDEIDLLWLMANILGTFAFPDTEELPAPM